MISQAAADCKCKKPARADTGPVLFYGVRKRLPHFLAAFEEGTDDHQNSKHDQVKQNRGAIGVESRKHHKQGAQDSQNGHHLAAETRQVIALHQGNINRDVQHVQCDNRQLGRVKAEGAKPSGSQVCAVKIYQPHTRNENTEHGGVGGHIGGGIDVLEHRPAWCFRHLPPDHTCRG